MCCWSLFIELVPNGNANDNAVSDMTIHGMRPFPPPDIENLLRCIEVLRRQQG